MLKQSCLQSLCKQECCCDLRPLHQGRTSGNHIYNSLCSYIQQANLPAKIDSYDQMIIQSNLIVSLYNRMIPPFNKIHSIDEFVLSLSKDDLTENPSIGGQANSDCQLLVPQYPADSDATGNRTRIAGLKTQCPNRQTIAPGSAGSTQLYPFV